MGLRALISNLLVLRDALFNLQDLKITIFISIIADLFRGPYFAYPSRPGMACDNYFPVPLKEGLANDAFLREM